VDNSADKTKKAVNCFFGKCDDGSTKEDKKVDEGKVDPNVANQKNIDDSKDDLKEFGDNASNSTSSTNSTNIIDIKPDPNFIHEKSEEKNHHNEEESSTEEITTTTYTTTTEVVETIVQEEVKILLKIFLISESLIVHNE
jgi:hypothetical protein